jgi:hypothetical protein
MISDQKSQADLPVQQQMRRQVIPSWIPPALPGRQQKFDISGSRIHRLIDEALNREPPSTQKSFID